ncbi:MAG: mannonate dehydratase [Paracoccaceae bacterium]
MHFLHLRNATRETAYIRGSLREAERLGGDTDMVALIAAALRQEAARLRRGAVRCVDPDAARSWVGYPR